MNTLMKINTAVFWVLALASYLLGWTGILGYLPMLAVVIFLAHIVEVAIFWTKFKHNSDNPVMDAINVLIFGVFHLKPLMK